MRPSTLGLEIFLSATVFQALLHSRRKRRLIYVFYSSLRPSPFLSHAPQKWPHAMRSEGGACSHLGLLCQISSTTPIFFWCSSRPAAGTNSSIYAVDGGGNVLIFLWWKEVGCCPEFDVYSPHFPPPLLGPLRWGALTQWPENKSKRWRHHFNFLLFCTRQRFDVLVQIDYLASYDFLVPFLEESLGSRVSLIQILP